MPIPLTKALQIGLVQIEEDDAFVTAAFTLNFEGGGGKVVDEGAGKVTIDITGGGGVAHTLLSATHTDTVAGVPIRGYMIRGNATPKWQRFDARSAGYIVQGDGVDVISQAFDWDVMAAALGADMVHDHSIAAEGGALPVASVPAHDLLSATHGDTTVQGVSRGSLVYGDATPTWNELVHPGGAGYALTTDANDVAWHQTPTWTGLHAFDGGWLLGAAQTADLAGVADALVLDADGDTTISAPTDDQIDFEVAGADQVHLSDGLFWPDVDGDMDLGDALHAFLDLHSVGHASLGNTGTVLATRVLNVFEDVDTADAFTGASLVFTKTAGATDLADDMAGVIVQFELDQAGGEVGYLFGGSIVVTLTQGTVGNAVGGARSLFGLYALADLDAGTVTGDAHGQQIALDQEAANTISGDAYGLLITADLDGTVTGTSYILYLSEGDGIDYGLYQDGTALNRLGGWLLAEGGVDINGLADGLVLDADGDTTISAPTDDQIDFEVAATDQVRLVDGALYSVVDGDVDLGALNLGWGDVYISGHVGVGVNVSATTVMYIVEDVDTVLSYSGFYLDIEKIAGATDWRDTLIGSYHRLELDQAGGEIGPFFAGQVIGVLNDGSVGNAGSGPADFVTLQSFSDLNSGTITRNFIGFDLEVDQEVANTISGSAYLAYLEASWLGTVTGTSFLLYMAGGVGIDYNIWQANSAINRFLGSVLAEGGVDLNGTELTLDMDADTSITASIDDQIDFEVAGTDQIRLVDGVLYPVMTNDINLGTGALEFKDAYFDGTVQTDLLQVDEYAAIGPTAALSADRLLDVSNTAVNSVGSVRGINLAVTKTAGASDLNDHMYGLVDVARFDQAAGEIGHMYGMYLVAGLNDGTIGNAVGGARNMQGMNVIVDLNAGIVTGSMYGMNFTIDQEAANTISGNAFGCLIYADFDGTVTGTTYMLYLSEATGVDFGIYQSGSADNYLGGRLGVNIVAPLAMIHADQSSSSGAIPVLALDQADLSEGFIDFLGASAASAVGPISTWTAGNSIQGFVRAEINGAAAWMPYYDAPTS